ncbi:hypothetical protein M378DRAFT_170045 [Amanita muscaria Koide BX008]|uniref:Uncharacterized protein n=1 Tax=Amanita muscaria (strain Koide BX008) TaxID=946122 RepID=A0A0C2SXJ8_AMAMK|nr:hypothetical protein M378DRAFT_170045 [Amanita muscaria Koide BX008]
MMRGESFTPEAVRSHRRDRLCGYKMISREVGPGRYRLVGGEGTRDEMIGVIREVGRHRNVSLSLA